MGMWKRKRNDDEVAGLRAELEARDEADQARRDAQRRQDETGYDPVSGRYTRPGRAARDRLARGQS